jgi:hypothetical protein
MDGEAIGPDLRDCPDLAAVKRVANMSCPTPFAEPQGRATQSRAACLFQPGPGASPRFGGCFTVRSATLTRRRLREPAAHSPQTGGWREAG